MNRPELVTAEVIRETQHDPMQLPAETLAQVRQLMMQGQPLYWRLREALGHGLGVDDLVWLVPNTWFAGEGGRFMEVPVVHADVAEPMLAHRLEWPRPPVVD